MSTDYAKRSNRCPERADGWGPLCVHNVGHNGHHLTSGGRVFPTYVPPQKAADPFDTGYQAGLEAGRKEMEAEIAALREPMAAHDATIRAEVFDQFADIALSVYGVEAGTHTPASLLQAVRERALEEAIERVQAARCGEADSDLRSIIWAIRALKGGSR